MTAGAPTTTHNPPARATLVCGFCSRSMAGISRDGIAGFQGKPYHKRCLAAVKAGWTHPGEAEAHYAKTGSYDKGAAPLPPVVVKAPEPTVVPTAAEAAQKIREEAERVAVPTPVATPSPAAANTVATNVTPTPTQDSRPWPEMPESATFRYREPGGAEVLRTVRAWTGRELEARLAATIDMIAKRGGTFLSDTRGAGKAPEAANAATENVPMCAIHNKPMKKREKDGKSWWSCGEKLSDGQWCNYRPKAS